MSELLRQIKQNRSRVFRRLYVKRRSKDTGLFESTWQEISSDVIKWGKITRSVDEAQYNRFKFGGVRFQVANDFGRFNPETNPSSLWFGFASPQRSLIRVEAGFVRETLGSDGIWTRVEYPTSGAGTAAAAFTGVLIGDTPTSDTNIVNINAAPLIDLFRQYPARLLDGYTATGLTASQFIESVRDHTDGSGSFVFRPFFGSTATGFNIQTTTVLYGELNTATGDDIIEANVWEVIEKLSQAESFVPYVDREGIFNFVERTNASVSTFEFHGARSTDREYGQTIKRISRAGPKYSKYYSRVNVRWDRAFTQTSVETVEATFKVTGNNLPWLYGHKTFDLTNRWIASASVAAQIATTIFNDVSSLKNEIELTASFVPQLEIFDRISLTYNNNAFLESSLWDLNKWSGKAGTESTLNSIDDIDSATIMFNPSWYFSQPFEATSTGFNVSRVRCALYYNSSPTTFGGYLLPEIWSDVGSVPSAMLFQGATTTLTELGMTTSNLGLTGTSANWAEFVFPSGANLSAGTRYHFVLRPDYVETADIAWAGFTNTTLERGKQSFDSGGSWNNTTRARGIEIYAYDGPVSDEVNLVWDEETGDALSLIDDEYTLLKVELDLDKFETKIVAREAT